jgi:hypothetical protein
MAKRTVRVIRTWDVDVDAEYGDSDRQLQGKVSEAYLDGTSPDAEDRLVMPHAESPYAKHGDIPATSGDEQEEVAWR